MILVRRGFRAGEGGGRLTRIEILGAESLGVRGLSCVVEVGTRRIVLDPGLALGYRRHGLLPHPRQVATGERVRRRITSALAGATDAVISHYHGDHIPLPDANPYQLSAQDVAALFRDVRIWAKGPAGLPESMLARRRSLGEALARELPEAEGLQQGPLSFSVAVPHGEPDTSLGTVMMTRIADADRIFVHASDIQLLDGRAVATILDWQPDVVLAGGPPVYLERLAPALRHEAWRNARQLAAGVATLILDHHLLRCEAGLAWLDRLAVETGGRVICAADFMGRPRRLLEARRPELYREQPVPDGWHEAYARGEADTSGYREPPGSEPREG